MLERSVSDTPHLKERESNTPSIFGTPLLTPVRFHLQRPNLAWRDKWRRGVFQESATPRILRGRSNSLPKMYWTLCMRAHGTRNSNQILLGNQTNWFFNRLRRYISSVLTYLLISGKILQVDPGTALAKNCCDTNADARSVCGSCRLVYIHFVNELNEWMNEWMNH